MAIHALVLTGSRTLKLVCKKKCVSCIRVNNDEDLPAEACWLLLSSIYIFFCFFSLLKVQGCITQSTGGSRSE